MKTKSLKLFIILVTLIFLGTGTALAGDRHGDRNQKRMNKNDVHHRIDRHHSHRQGNHYKKHVPPRHHGRHYGPRYYGRHDGPKHYYKHHKRFRHYRRPTVHKHHHHYYRGSYGYPAYNSFSFGVAVFDPNMAFSIGVSGH